MDDNNKINTGGGSLTKGDVKAKGDFVGRDVNKTTLVSGSLIIAIVAVLLVGIIGIAAVVKRNVGESTSDPIVTLQPTQSFPLSTQPPSSHTGTPAAGWQACVGQYFSDVRKNEWTAVEVGAYDQALAFSLQNQLTTGIIGPLGVALTENGQPLALIKFNLVSSGRLIKIVSVLNAHCQAVEEYSDAIQPGKNTLHNDDTLTIQLPEGMYNIRFKWDSGDIIQFDFRRVN